jgi:hypothetical protein
MNAQRQHCLQLHVAQRRHGIARIENALNIKTSRYVVTETLLPDGNRSATVFLLEDQGASSVRNEQQIRKAI